MPVTAASHGFRLLPQGLHPAILVGLAAAGIAAWVALRFAGREAKSLKLRAALAGASVALGFGALMMAAQAAEQWLVLASNWPLWVGAALGSVAIESLLQLYRAERRTVSARAGLALGALRVGLAASLLLMLAQPVFVRKHESNVQRYVAVLLDRSASMQVPDTQLSVSDKVRLAELLAPEQVRRPYRLEAAARELEAASSKLAVQREWLGMLGEFDPDTRQKHLESQRAALHDALNVSGATVGKELKSLDDMLAAQPALAQETRAALSQARDQLAKQVADRLRAAEDLVAPAVATAAAGQGAPAPSTAPPATGDPAARLREAISGATEALGKVAPTLREQGKVLDEAYYGSFSEQQRAAVDAIARKTRLELATDVLFGRPEGSGTPDASFKGLLSGLKARYGVRAYTFASEPAEMDAASLRADSGSPKPNDLQTDVAAALQRVLTDVPSKQLAGIVMLTDGRHNAPSRVEPLAARLGTESASGSPVSSIIFGSEKPPTDAAIVSIEAPDTVYAGDRVYIAAQVKLDGMAGRKVTVKLSKGDAVVQSQTIEVPAQAYRTRVELSDSPSEKGLLSYRVAVDGSDDEVIKTNNEYPVTVSVTDDQVRLLLVDGRPRWEFRYLKNLFASRDKTVRLQYVLFDPDSVSGMPAKPSARASASRTTGGAEATSLPNDDQEWAKFDVVVLGDVQPSELPLAGQEAIRRFVVDRGGTLVMIAGPHSMPRAFTGTLLDQLLPVQLRPTTADPVPTPDESFGVALTPEGRDNVIMRLKGDPQENVAFWSSRPEAHWRYPIAEVKPRATVLAYAQPAGRDAPQSRGAGEHADRRFQAEHALVVTQNAGLGQVVFLAFDETWRLRYREGDTYHHKFWGQLLRWATANKLPAGTNLVKLGTSQARYPLHCRVEVRARIMQPDLTPLAGGQVAALVFKDDQLVLRRRLEYIGDAPGTYAADLGELPSGQYRVELEGPQVQAILAGERASKVATGFSVDAASSTEQVELAADPGLPGLLARLTGGVVVGPPEAAQVLDNLGPSTLALEERREYALWSSWPLLGLMIVLATAEWLLRKKVGLP